MSEDKNTNAGAAVSPTEPPIPIPPTSGKKDIRAKLGRSVRRAEIAGGGVQITEPTRGNRNGAERVSRFNAKFRLPDGRMAVQVNLLHEEMTTAQVIEEWKSRGWEPVPEHKAKDENKMVFATNEDFLAGAERKATEIFKSKIRRPDKSKDIDPTTETFKVGATADKYLSASQLKEQLPSESDLDENEGDFEGDDGEDDGDDTGLE